MAVPATTGVLRTKVSDMQIGDYIYTVFLLNSTTDATLNTIQASTFGSATEPYSTNYGVSGMTTGNSPFYFIKVDKGLLIADRVIQNSIAWDTLNAAKYIQGLPWDAGNIIPAMTSNTAPSGSVSSGNPYPTSGDYQAFDRNASTFWGNSSWVSYDFGSPKCIKQYTVTARTGYVTTSAPKDWTFDGWNGTNWVVLDIRKGVSGWVDNTKKVFVFNNTSLYSQYRINVTAKQDSTYAAQIQELEMMDTAGIIRSLTGGVAYAEADGTLNPGLANNYGGWPTNNEWDIYIVKSNLNGKITASDDNVWHWSPCSTWARDTGMFGNGYGWSNTSRVNRGKSSKIALGSIASSTVNITTGFRPVFEYKE